MRTSLALVCGVTAAIAMTSSALAQPSIPATFFGSVTVDGEPAAPGVEVRALVSGVDCTQAPPGSRPVIRDGESAAYVLHVVHESQRPGCAREGSVVTFTIAGSAAVQQSTWRPGPIRLDLSTGAASPIPLPSPTGTVAAALTAGGNSTQMPATNTPLPRPSGAPPTDAVDVPGLTSSRTPATSGSVPADEGSAFGLVAVIGVALLALGGGAVGVVFSRRRARARAEPPGA